MGKSSLANTFARYLKSPKDIPTPVLTEDNQDLLCTQVMQLYDGLSINKMKDLSVQVEELTPSVKLVKLESNLPVIVEESNLPVSDKEEESDLPVSVKVEESNQPVKVGKRQLIKNKLSSLFTRAPASPKESIPEESLPEEPLPEEPLQKEPLPEKPLPEEPLPEEFQVKLVDMGGHTATSLKAFRCHSFHRICFS